VAVTGPSTKWTTRPAGWECPWPPVELNQLKDPPPPFGFSRDPLTRGLSWPPSYKEKAFSPSPTLRKATAHAARPDCPADTRSATELRVKAEQQHIAWRNTRLLNLSVASQSGLLLFLKYKRAHHLNLGTLPVACLTRAERIHHCARLQEAAVACRLCEGLEDEWTDEETTDT